MSDLRDWLSRIGLERHAETLARAEVDLEILPDLSDDDLRELGLPLGARRRIQRALAGEGAAPPEKGGTVREEDRGPPAAGADRRQLSILFADLAGSTELSTRLDPEDLRRVLQEFQDTCEREVVRYGGYVAKFMGDGALAYFGYPEAHENDAERAIHAGLGIVEATRSAGSSSIRVGIATGPVVVGDIIGREASQEAAVVGKTPNLAARLQSLAPPNTVVIDADTRELATGLFDLESLGAHELKGFDAPQPAWSVRCSRAPESRFAASRRRPVSALVGRDEELEMLLRRWARAEAGEGQLVLVSGEPGIGKSRLAHALLGRLEGTPHTRLRYQCSPFHTNSPLHPVVEQLERAAGIASEDDPDRKLDRLATLVAAVGRSAEEDVPLLAELLSVPGGERFPPPNVIPPRRKELVLETLVGHLAALSEREPVLFLLEDAHWIDPTTQDLLDVTIERLPGLPVLMVVTHRPRYVAPWVGRPHVTLSSLARLDPRESALLVEGVSGGDPLPATVVERIVEKTDGVPLFVEEFTRAAIESGRTGEDIAIPATLQDALEARMGRLGLDREVAQVGAVIGRSFEHDLLSRVFPGEEERLRRALADLVDAQLIFSRGEAPAATYTFKHALVQDTAYDSLLRERRVEIHRTIARVLEEEFPTTAEEQPEVLAHHLTEGGRLDRAVDYWERAGRLAHRRHAIDESIHHFQRAVEVVGRLPDEDATKARELELQIHLAPVHMAAVGFGAPAAERAYRRAVELARELGHEQHRFHAQWGLWMMNLQRPRPGLERPLIDQLFELDDGAPDGGRRLQACHASWTSHFFGGKFRECRERAEEGVRLYDPEGHASHKFLYGGHDPGICARNFLTISLAQLGHPDTACRVAAEADELAERVAHPMSSIANHLVASHLYLFRREPDLGSRHVERAVALAEEYGTSGAVWAGTCRGWINAVQGEPEQGLAQMEAAIHGDAHGSWAPFRAYYLGRMAEISLALGDGHRARSSIDRALEEVERTQRYCWTADLVRVCGEVHLAEGDAGSAEECFLSSLDRAEEQGSVMWRLRAATSLARLWAGTDRRSEGRDRIADAIEGFAEGHGLADFREAAALFAELGAGR